MVSSNGSVINIAKEGVRQKRLVSFLVIFRQWEPLQGRWVEKTQRLQVEEGQLGTEQTLINWIQENRVTVGRVPEIVSIVSAAPCGKVQPLSAALPIAAVGGVSIE